MSESRTATGFRSRGALSCGFENRADHREWDVFLAGTRGGDLVQSSVWGRFKQASGMEVQRVVVRADGVIVGGAQLVVRRFRLLGAVAYVPYGPIISVDAPTATPAMLARSLRSLCRQLAIRAMFVQPPHDGEVVAAALCGVGFEPSETHVAPAASIRLDIQREPDEILAAMSRHTRKDIRQSWRDPLRVRFGTRNDLGSFYDLYCCTADRHGFRPLPRHYFEVLWDHLHPTGQIQMFLCDANGPDVAVSVITCFGDTVTGRFVGFDPRRLPGRMRPTESLEWTCINWAHSHGFVALDLGGIERSQALAATGGTSDDASNTSDVNHKLWFGGVPILYPEPLELIPNRAARATLGALRTSPRFQALREATERRARAGSHTGHTD